VTLAPGISRAGLSAEKSIHPSQEMKCRVGDTYAPTLMDFEVSRINANETAGIVLAEPAHCGNRATCSEF